MASNAKNLQNAPQRGKTVAVLGEQFLLVKVGTSSRKKPAGAGR
ncbi:MAG: hypothetical protein AB1430_08980 [Pseudomonadota bacterium]